ncbi:hypothetical protein ACFOEZ_09755 [Tianweitania populi]|uniref:hypothetical protein n=1 Tax=Tianweitania populi TaxID=1607949 RepID=UPI00167AB1C4|nr:hypothetical protein [Tianweitania populi]
MKAYWNDCGDELPSAVARDVDLAEAGRIWSDVVRGVEGNFLGLIDDQDRTVQFYFTAGIPDDVDDASHLPIVLLDLPQPDQSGSYERQVTIGEVHRLIEAAFRHGADPRQFGALSFSQW